MTNQMTSHNQATKKEGLRERKRRETHQCIVETGLKLFIENGYESTTMEAIATTAGISRRTLFYYFKSKDDILLAAQGDGFIEALRNALVGASSEQEPFMVVRKVLPALVSRFESEESIVIDRLMRSTESLRARKQALFVEMEQVLLTALCELWPQPEQQSTLRIVAMVSIGAMRLAMEAWRNDDEHRPLAEHLREGFAILEDHI
jgi:AcrR family transcriptional regulator